MFYEFEHFGISEHFCKEYGENFTYPNHLHQSFELVAAIEGTMTVNINNTPYIISQGEAVLIFPHQLHSMSGDGSRHVLCIFSPEIVKEYSSRTSDKLPVCNKFILNDYLRDEINKLGDNSSKTRIKGLLYTICSEFDEEAEYISQKSIGHNLLYRIFRYVENNYSRDFSLEKLSGDMGFSYHYISRYFKNSVGITLNTYINMYRISKACYLLNNTNCTVIQCAMECGYSSLRSFNRNFKAHTGTTPMEYKRKG